MELDKIVTEIAGGLTGNAKTDLPYLMSQVEKYRNHQLSGEILRACGRLVFGCIPEKKRPELCRIVSGRGRL